MDITEMLLKWYVENKRDLPWRHTSDPYSVLVSEVMLQQTRVDTVIGYYERFMRLFPNARALADASETDVLNAWKGLGYYSRARNLQKAVKAVCDSGGIFPDTTEGWRALPGVGDYIAGAVMSIALNEPCAAVDGNVLRVISRIYGLKDDIASPAARNGITNRVKGMIPQNRASDFTQALMELGALICKPVSPDCALCPVKSKCTALSRNLVGLIPVKTPKKPPRDIRMVISAIICGPSILMECREKGALLAGMWGLPAVEFAEGKTPERLIKERYEMKPGKGVLIGHACHIFTHQRWNMDIYLHHVQKPFYVAENMEWVLLDGIDQIPVPKAFQKAIAVFREYYAGRGDINE